MNETWDVAIVGGGFAGSLTACALARHGCRVVILERGKQSGRETRSGNLATDAWCRGFGLDRPDSQPLGLSYGDQLVVAGQEASSRSRAHATGLHVCSVGSDHAASALDVGLPLGIPMTAGLNGAAGPE